MRSCGRRRRSRAVAEEDGHSLHRPAGRDASKIDEALEVARDTAQRVLGGGRQLT